MVRRLLIFGPPGAGKGTHAKRLAHDLGVPHIATGEMLRGAIASKTPLGAKAEAYIRRGELVPDELVVSLLRARIADESGWLLDGFPRTVPQAKALATMLDESDVKLDGMLSMDAPEELLLNRIAGRRTCDGCQAVWNEFYRPPAKTGVCDDCGGNLSHRPDDEEHAVRRRLAEYRTKTSPVLAFFAEKRVPIWTVISTNDVDDVYDHIKKSVGIS